MHIIKTETYWIHTIGRMLLGNCQGEKTAEKSCLTEKHSTKKQFTKEHHGNSQCDSFPLKTEQDILQDLQPFAEKLTAVPGTDFVKVSIRRRRTDLEDLSDVIQLMARYVSDTICGEVSLMAVYALGKDGWNLNLAYPSRSKKGVLCTDKLYSMG